MPLFGFTSSFCVPQAELAEALQFCELFVLGHPENVGKPGVRETMFPALAKPRLIVALKRYRDVHTHFQHGHGLPGLQVGPCQADDNWHMSS